MRDIDANASRTTERLRHLLRDDRGLSTVEYVVILVLVAAGAMALWHTFGNSLRTSVDKAHGGLSTLDTSLADSASASRGGIPSGLAPESALGGPGNGSGDSRAGGASERAGGASSALHRSGGSAPAGPGSGERGGGSAASGIAPGGAASPSGAASPGGAAPPGGATSPGSAAAATPAGGTRAGAAASGDVPGSASGNAPGGGPRGAASASGASSANRGGASSANRGGAEAGGAEAGGAPPSGATQAGRGALAGVQQALTPGAGGPVPSSASVPVAGGQAMAEASRGPTLLITGADLATDFTPGVSNLKDASIALTGVNPVTGENVGTVGRVAAGVFAVPGAGNAVKYVAKGGKLAVKVGQAAWKERKLIGKAARGAYEFARESKAVRAVAGWFGRTAEREVVAEGAERVAREGAEAGAERVAREGAQGVAKEGTEGAARGATEIPNLDMSKQGKHIPGHNNYRSGRSVLTADPNELAKRAGTGIPVGKVPRGQPGFRERVHFDDAIGDFVKDGVAMPTKNGIIHYAKDGIHIVPAAP